MSEVDVIPLADRRRHRVPEGYTDDPAGGWLALERRVTGLFPPCWCAPYVEPTIGPDGEISAVYVHRAADHRETTEREAA